MNFNRQSAKGSSSSSSSPSRFLVSDFFFFPSTPAAANDGVVALICSKGGDLSIASHRLRNLPDPTSDWREF